MLHESLAIDGFSDSIGGISTTNRKQIRPIRWFTIDYDLIQTLRKINHRNSLAMRCRTYIQDHLFSNDFLIYNSKGKEMKMTPEFKKFFYKWYRPFGMAAIDCIMTLGFIPVVLRQHRNGHMYPVVPADDTYVVQVGYALDTEKRYYRVWRPKMFKLTGKDEKNTSDTSAELAGFLSGFVPKIPMGAKGGMGGNGLSGLGGYGGLIQGSSGMAGTGGVQENWFIDETVNIIDGFGHDPTVYGELTSPLRSILDDFTFTNTLGDRLLVSEYIMTNPTHLLQYHKDKDPDEKIDVSTGRQAFNFDADEFNLQSSEHMEMTKKQISTLSQQMRMVAMAQEKGRTTDGLSKLEKSIQNGMTVAPNLVVYPKGLESVKGEGLERFVGNKYVTIRQLFDDNLSAIYGIPLAIMRNVGNLRGNQTEQTNIFRQTLKKYAKMLSEILTIAFNEAYSGEEEKLEDNLFRKKAVVDDTGFTKIVFKSKTGAKVEVMKDESDTIPIPKDTDVIFENSKQISFGADSERKTGGANAPTFSNDREKNMRKIIEELQKNNKEYKDRLKELEREKKEKEKEKNSRHDNMDDEYGGGSGGGKKRKRSEFSSESSKNESFGRNKRIKRGDEKDQVIIKVDITSFMDAKMVKHAYDSGAITTEDYQRLLRNRLDFTDFDYKKPNATAERILAETFKAVGSAPPREDAMEPESENLGSMAKRFEQTQNVPSGLLIDLAQKNGNVKELANEKDAERVKKDAEKEKKKKEKETKSKKKDAPKSSSTNSKNQK